MNKKVKTLTTVSALLLAMALVTACNDTNKTASGDNQPAVNNAGTNNQGNAVPGDSETDNSKNNDQGNSSTDNSGADNTGSSEEGTGPDMAAASDVNSVAVLVNKEFALPDDYNPSDLVYPNVRFTFKEKIEKRMMRSEAAKALENLFDGAEKDGIYLAGVSAYRSHKTQTALFNRYVERDGEEKAKTYSAVPGHSEHETGLAIDVSGSDGKCAAEDCFGDTKEAEWLAKHASEYGFIIRYPEGKDSITGYKYEPWHIRYVGVDIASEIADRGITLEEYYGSIPVTANP
ncbi:D-alanyl-D-alanine carboxypeptidase family protein [Paenibacillus motobuensis]|uniref:M15 family metallopeptidase n=1 Tax=Paenibacillus TaxID=44249 RepID=UPI00203CB14B|nr:MULTISPECIES: M15 family metallopeptidase [Paenibacillus]MCM3041020.1 D-alanyl-D-alanine carboxypeptidase family protein [Paenibacillus lutimineralis]MCM3648124.1 D-alanyl-D-alanine carboxypeptidase family protein [Paenibacillus motobuensis]